MKMQKLPERELNILRITSKRVLRVENNIILHILFYFFNSSAIQINEPLFIIVLSSSPIWSWWTNLHSKRPEKLTEVHWFGSIFVGDGCWRRNVFTRTLSCRLRFGGPSPTAITLKFKAWTWALMGSFTELSLERRPISNRIFSILDDSSITIIHQNEPNFSLKTWPHKILHPTWQTSSFGTF